MNILLVNPINRSYLVVPSLGLGYIAAVTRQSDHEVTILDCKKERFTFDDFVRFISEDHFDVIGFQVYSYDITPLSKHLSLIRKSSPTTITIAGGAHPSGDPLNILTSLPQLDYAFAGEAEIGFPRLLEKLERPTPDLSSVPGLIYRQDDTIQLNPPKVIEDLDALPMPAWDLVMPETYPDSPHGAFSNQFPAAPIIVTRGCAYLCTFCAGKTITGRKIRSRSIDNVIEELRYLRQRGIREFYIEDENFTFVKEKVLEFCEQLRKEELGMTWSLPSGVRIDNLDTQMLVAMEKAGCHSLAVGIDFGTQRMMDLTNKNLTIEIVRQKMDLLKDSGIKTTGFFMLGVPDETVEEMGETIRFACQLPLDRVQFNNYMPLPGSDLWKRLSLSGQLKQIDWDKFFVHAVAFTDNGISSRAIKNLQRKAYLKFYLRLRILVRLLGEVKSFHQLKYLFKRFIDAVF